MENNLRLAPAVILIHPYNQRGHILQGWKQMATEMKTATKKKTTTKKKRKEHVTNALKQ